MLGQIFRLPLTGKVGERWLMEAGIKDFANNTNKSGVGMNGGRCNCVRHAYRMPGMKEKRS